MEGQKGKERKYGLNLLANNAHRVKLTGIFVLFKVYYWFTTNKYKLYTKKLYTNYITFYTISNIFLNLTNNNIKHKYTKRDKTKNLKRC